MPKSPEQPTNNPDNEKPQSLGDHFATLKGTQEAEPAVTGDSIHDVPPVEPSVADTSDGAGSTKVKGKKPDNIGYSIERVNEETNQAWQAFDKGEINAEEYERRLNDLLDKFKGLTSKKGDKGEKSGVRFEAAKEDAARAVAEAKAIEAKKAPEAVMEKPPEPVKVEEPKPEMTGLEATEENQPIPNAEGSRTPVSTVEVVDTTPPGAIEKGQDVAYENFKQRAEEAFVEKVGTREDYIRAHIDEKGGVFEQKYRAKISEAAKNLSDKQREKYNDLMRSSINRRESHPLSAKQVEGLFAAGKSFEDILDTKRAHWWSDKFKSKILPDKVLSEQDFDKEIDEIVQKSDSKIREDVEKEIGREWDEMRERAVLTITKKTLEERAMQVEEARQKQERAEELRVKKEEQETKKQKKAEAKIEADAKRNEDAENMPDKERAKLLVELKKNWKEANRHYEQQKTNESHDDIATVRREQLSDRMVDIAKELTGEDIIGDALALSGCDPSGPKDDKQREAFRRQLTKNVEAIFDEQVKKLPEKYRKKAKAPDGRKIITNQRRSPAERLAVKNNPAMIAEREQRDLRRKWDAWLRETLLATGATTTQELFDRFEKGEISLDEGDKDDPEIMENVRQFLLLKLEEEKAQDEKIKIK